MAQLRKASCWQTRLLKKTTEGNLGLERLGLTGEEDSERTKKEARREREAKELEREAERQIREEAGPEREAEREKKTER